MKNLINKHSIEDLEILPVELLSLKLQKRHLNFLHRKHNKRGHYHDVPTKEGVNPYKLAEYIVRKYIGRLYNDAYSEFCSKVKWWQKEAFKDLFDTSYKYNRSLRYTEFIIDDNGLIQYNIRYFGYNKYKGPYSIKSDDFKTEKIHKITGHKFDKFKSVYEKVAYSYWSGRNRHSKGVYMKGFKDGKLLYYEYGANWSNFKPLHKRYKAQEEDFETIVVSGWIKYYNSKQDPEYKRYKREKRKYNSKTTKQKRIEQAEKAYSFISQTELQLKKEKELNTYNIARLGFDPITSFRGVQKLSPTGINGVFKEEN